MKSFYKIAGILAGLLGNMDATVSTSALVSSAPTATSVQKRDVSDTIRHLFPGYPTMSLVNSGDVGEDVTKTRGLIKKRGVDGVKYECFNYSPLGVLFTISTYTSATSITLSSVEGLTLKMCLVDTTNHTVCRIGAINTSTKVVTVTSVGTTAFSSAADRTLLALAPVYADNSSSPYIQMKDEDNLYNILEISRFPSAISASNKGNPFYGKDYWQRVRKQVLMEGFRKVEHSAIFSERPSSTNLTTTDGTLADAFRTTRGLWNWAVGGGASFNAQGNMTHEKLYKDLVLQMNTTVGPDSKLVMYCSRNAYGDMIGWMTEKLMVTELGTLKNFGVKSKIFLTAGPEIEVIVHDAFNHGANTKVALLFDTTPVEYCFKKGRDFHPVLGIQNNDVDGVEDDLLGEWGMGVEDGGSTMTIITNWS